MAQGDVCVVDCRTELMDRDAGRRSYEKSHIPGAVFMDLDQDLASPPTATSGRHPLPEPSMFAATAGQLGISQETPLVVYDQGSGAFAARAWWVFRWLGHDNVRLLDGGFAAWSECFGSCSEPVSRESATFEVNEQAEMTVSAADIQAAIAEVTALKLLDARDPARFRGEVEPIDRVAGHIPGAANFPFQASLNEGGYWKSRSDLEALWQQECGQTRDSERVVMCGSGVTACHLIISALEAGYGQPRLYVGSWSEWIADKTRPIATG